MLVLNLGCAQDHRFEGWFGSSEDFESQQQRGLLTCPVCGAHEVKRLPSAPHLNMSRRPEPAVVPVSGPGGAVSPTPVAPQDRPQQLQQLALQAVRHLLANTEDVGSRFAEEARRIHYGEAEVRGIRGKVSLDEAQALAEEGIEAVPLPLPEGLDGPLQ